MTGMYGAVRGWPRVSVLVFHLVFAVYHCTCQASWPQASGASPVSTAYFNIEALELQTCSFLSTFWRIQTQVFKFVHQTLYPSEPFRMLESCPEMNASLAL